jgi:hypothetical protein
MLRSTVGMRSVAPSSLSSIGNSSRRQKDRMLVYVVNWSSNPTLKIFLVYMRTSSERK